MSRLRGLLLGLAALTAAAPAVGAPLPAPEEMARTPAERALFERIRQFGAASNDARPTPAVLADLLARGDALLAELPRPTPLRGLVQMLRTDILGYAGRGEDATAAAQEAIALLPGYSLPLYTAATVETYRNRPREAVDHYAAAAAIDLEPLAEVGDFDIHSLMVRLNEKRDDEALVRLAELLARAGWRGAPDTESTLALARIEARLKAGDIEGATRLVGAVVRPGALSAIFTDRLFAPVRPAARLHAGPRLEKAWPRYLATTQAQWQSKAHDRALRLYATALVAAGHDRSLIATFEPLFAGMIDPGDDEFLFASGPVARAYARTGQWERGYDLLDKVAAAFSGLELANRLNIESARAGLLRDQGRSEEALSAFDSLIARSGRYAEEVGEHNLVVMHGQRACMLEELGRRPEASESARIVRERASVSVVPLVALLVCRDDLDGARAAIVAGLDGEMTRPGALNLVQPPERGPYPSDYSRREAERWARLRADPQVRAAALRHGDLLPGPLNASAPPDPLPASPAPRR